MTTVYVIEDGVGTCYVGVTDNYSYRMHQHKTRQVPTTARMVAPRKVIHKWECPTRVAALQLESFIHKSLKGPLADKATVGPLMELITDCPLYSKVLQEATAHIRVNETKISFAN